MRPEINFDLKFTDLSKTQQKEYLFSDELLEIIFRIIRSNDIDIKENINYNEYLYIKNLITNFFINELDNIITFPININAITDYINDESYLFNDADIKIFNDLFIKPYTSINANDNIFLIKETNLNIYVGVQFEMRNFNLSLKFYDTINYKFIILTADSTIKYFITENNWLLDKNLLK